MHDGPWHDVLLSRSGCRAQLSWVLWSHQPRGVVSPVLRRVLLALDAPAAGQSAATRCCRGCAAGTLLPPRSTPTSAVLRSLEHVRNARDLAEATGCIAPGRVFRSACPNSASEADAEALQQTLGISELVRVGFGGRFRVYAFTQTMQLVR